VLKPHIAFPTLLLSPAKRGSLSLKLVGVRGKAPPSRSSAKRSTPPAPARSAMLLIWMMRQSHKSSTYSDCWTNGTGGYMRPKPCSLCGQPADFSFVLLASTLRLSPRRQKSSESIAICETCIRAVINSRTTADEVRPASPLNYALTTCYHALTKHSANERDLPFPENFADEHLQSTAQPTTLGTEPVSCRPCLIACNSRKFTRQQGNEPSDNSGSGSC